jgi:hypothetical protein
MDGEPHGLFAIAHSQGVSLPHRLHQHTAGHSGFVTNTSHIL